MCTALETIRQKAASRLVTANAEFGNALTAKATERKRCRIAIAMGSAKLENDLAEAALKKHRRVHDVASFSTGFTGEPLEYPFDDTSVAAERGRLLLEKSKEE